MSHKDIYDDDDDESDKASDGPDAPEDAATAVGDVEAGGAAAAERSQSTLTIIVKFDKAGKVRDLAYHTSKF